MNQNCQKRMIVLKNPNSPLFEEAYLILKDSPNPEILESCDILEEANRLIGSRNFALCEDKPRKGWLFFVLGLFSSGIPMTLIYFLFLH